MGMYAQSQLAFGVFLGTEEEIPKSLNELQNDKDSIVYIEYFVIENVYYHALVLKKPSIVSDTDSPTFIKQTELEITQEQMNSFKDFCKTHNVNGAPQWMLLTKLG
jgi:hypothetical protein